jgi:hypothetical protein
VVVASFPTGKVESLGRRQIFYAKKNSGRGSSRFHSCPNIYIHTYIQSLYTNDALVAPGTNLALFVDDTCIYVTEKHERHVLCKLQHGLSAVNSWCECWNIKINEGKTQAIYFSTRLKSP